MHSCRIYFDLKKILHIEQFTTQYLLTIIHNSKTL